MSTNNSDTDSKIDDSNNNKASSEVVPPPTPDEKKEVVQTATPTLLRHNKPRLNYVYKTPESQRRAANVWRLRNLEISRENSRAYYYANKDTILQRLKEKYHAKKDHQ